jgi:hypothetical protein
LLRMQRWSGGVVVRALRPDDKVDRMAWFNPEDDTSHSVRKFRWAMTGIVLAEALAVITMLILVGLTR